MNLTTIKITVDCDKIKILYQKNMTMLKDLFNSLLDKWRKPFDMEFTKFHHISKNGAIFFYKWKKHHEWSRNVRDFVSKESLLRQFVCNHWLINTDDKWERIKNFRFDWAWWISLDWQFYFREYQYRLIESALRSEDELEEFLLQNIKIQNQNFIS